MREELGQEIEQQVSLCLILGSDAFVKLNTWHRWQELLNYCHIVLVQRPNPTVQPKLPEELTALLHDHYTESSEDLKTKTAGYIHMQKITPLDISSTKIRDALKTGRSQRYLMPYNIIEYISTHKLYG